MSAQLSPGAKFRQALVNNKPDLDCPISLKQDEVSREWYSALSAVDMHHVNLVDINRL